VENRACFSLPTGHHTRWFCERTAKVRVARENGRRKVEIFLEKGVKIASARDYIEVKNISALCRGLYLFSPGC